MHKQNHEHCSKKCHDSSQNCETEISCGGCACCSEEEESEVSIWEIVGSLLFFAAGILAEPVFHAPELVTAVLFGLSIILAGWRVCVKGFRSLIKLRIDETLLMSIAVIAAFCLREYFEAAMVAILFQLGEMLEDKAVDRSRKNIEKLADLRPDTARRLLDGKEEVVNAQQIAAGDLILIRPFERVPLDGIVTEGNSALDSSALTGESIPIDATVGTEVLSGMMNEHAPLTVRVTNDFYNSAASRIIDMVESASARKGHAEKLITRFASIYTPIVVLMAVLLMAVPPLFGFGDFRDWLYRALVFLVASCPCALVISVPLGFYAGIGAQSKNGILIKGGKYLEALSKVKAVVFDKTGTLTSGKLTVSKIHAADGFTEDTLLQLAAAAEQYSSHPAAKAILSAAGDHQLPAVENAMEVPGHGVKCTIDGKQVLCGRAICWKATEWICPPRNLPPFIFP